MHALGHLLLESLLVERLGWTLVHFLWQGTLIALLLAVLMVLMSGASAAARYVVSCTALVLCVAAVVITFLHLAPPLPVKVILGPSAGSPQGVSKTTYAPMPAPVSSAGRTSPASSPVPTAAVVSPKAAASMTSPSVASAPAIVWRAHLERALPSIVFVWLCGVFLVSLRLGAGWLGMRSLRMHSRPAVEGHWETRVCVLCERLGIRRAVKFLESHALTGPITMGWLRPLVIFPAALLTRLPVEQLEMILAHELAHVRRHDFLVNWLQCVVETVLFYHPAVWWINHRIRAERENCCDDLAAAVTGDRVLYANALVTLAEERRAAFENIAPAARGGSLLGRVSRLVAPPPGRPRMSTRAGAGLALLLLTAGVGAFTISKMVAHAAESAASSAPPRGVVVDKDGKPQSDAEVMVYWRKRPCFHRVMQEANSPDEIMERVRTDAEGRFQFTKSLHFLSWDQMGAGLDQFYVIAKAKDLAPGWLVLTPYTISQSQDLRIISGPTVDLTWILKDKAGKPVPGVEAELVSALVKSPGDSRLSIRLTKDTGLVHAVSDAEGKLVLHCMPRNDGYLHLRRGTEVESIYTEYDPVDNAKPRELTFDPDYSVMGRVTDELGRPVAGTRVWFHILWQFEYYDFIFNAVTDDDGRYRINGFMKQGHPQSEANGDFRVWIEHPKYASAPQVFHLAKEPSVQTLDLHVQTGTQVTGKFLGGKDGQPLAGAVLRFENPGARFNIVTDPQGRFRGAFPPGRFNITVEATAPGFWFDEERMYHDLAVEDKPLKVDLSPATFAKRVARITGKVTQPDGSPAPDVEVALSAHRSFINAYRGGAFLYAESTRTRKDGTFTIAEAPSEGKLEIQARTGKAAAVAFSTIDLYEGNVAFPQPLQLQTTRTVELLVTDLEGKPQPKLGIRAALLEFGQKHFYATTDDKGVAKLPGIVPGLEYTITVDAGGWVPLLMTFDKADTTRHSIVIADEYVVRAVNERNETIPVQSIPHVSTWHRGEDRQQYWGSLEVKRLRPDGSVVIQRNLQPFYATKIEMEFVPVGTGEPFTAEGVWPHDGTSTIIMHAKGGLAPVEWAEKPDLNAGPDEVALAVVNEKKEPISGATARWMPFEKDAAQLPKSDAQGIVRLPRPTTNDGYVVPILQIEAPGYASRWLVKSAVGKGIQVFLDRSTRLKGQLKGEDGANLPGRVEITLMRVKPAREGYGIQTSSPVLMHFETDDAGRYDLLVEPGTYSARLSSKASDVSVLSKFDIVPGKTTAFPERLGKGIPYRIRVAELGTGRPLPGIEVSVMDSFPNVTGQWKHDNYSPQITDADGVARWEALPEADTHFSVRPPKEGPNAFFLGRTLSADALDDYARPKAGKLSIGNGGGGYGMRLAVNPRHTSSTIEMERGMHLHGQVKRPDGTGVLCTVVLVGYYSAYSPAEITPLFIKTDEQGHYDQWFPAGNGMSYHVCAFADKGQTPMPNAVTASFDSKPGDDINKDVIVKPGARVSGKIINANGPLPAHLKVRLEAEDRRDPDRARPEVEVDANGHYEFPRVRAARYHVRVSQYRSNGSYTSMDTEPDVNLQDGQSVELGERKIHWAKDR